jgi:hypothetical protein
VNMDDDIIEYLQQAADMDDRAALYMTLFDLDDFRGDLGDKRFETTCIDNTYNGLTPYTIEDFGEELCKDGYTMMVYADGHPVMLTDQDSVGEYQVIQLIFFKGDKPDDISDAVIDPEEVE